MWRLVKSEPPLALLRGFEGSSGGADRAEPRLCALVHRALNGLAQAEAIHQPGTGQPVQHGQPESHGIAAWRGL
jgi:hypothetical protein